MSRRRKNKRKKVGSALKKHQQNERYLKGLVFESVLQELIKKAGFQKDEYFNQYNFKQTKLHGRGAVHQIDISGIFKLGIPFINPILLIGEAKNLNHRVRVSQVRQFLGAYVDIIQFNRVETKKGWAVRYKNILQPKVTYCPVFFSMKGFNRSAQGLMYAHNINYLSYENSEIMEQVKKLVERLLKQVKSSKINTKDFAVFHELGNLKGLRAEAKKSDYDKAAHKLIAYVSRIKSYLGTLDRNYPIHVLSKKVRTPNKQREVKLVYDGNTGFTIKSVKDKQYGKFYLSKEFVHQYVKNAIGRGKREIVFRQIDLVLPFGEGATIIHLKVAETSRNEIIQQIVPNTESAKQ